MRQGDAARAGNHVFQPRRLAPGQQPWHADEGGVDQRFGQAGTPAFRRNQGGFDQPHAQPALFLGHEQAGQAHLDQPLPDGGIAVALLIKSTQDFRPVGSG